MRKLPVVPICRTCSRLLRRANHDDALAHPASMKRDVSADRHDTWGGDAMDANGTRDERGLMRTAKSCGSGAPKQALRSRDLSCERRWQPSNGHRGERDISRKTIAQGMPVDPADPVVTAACFFCCRRAMGEAITRHSLRPLRFLRGPSYKQHSGANAPRDRRRVPQAAPTWRGAMAPIVACSVLDCLCLRARNDEAIGCLNV